MASRLGALRVPEPTARSTKKVAPSAPVQRQTFARAVVYGASGYTLGALVGAGPLGLIAGTLAWALR